MANKIFICTINQQLINNKLFKVFHQKNKQAKYIKWHIAYTAPFCTLSQRQISWVQYVILIRTVAQYRELLLDYKVS